MVVGLAVIGLPACDRNAGDFEGGGFSSAKNVAPPSSNQGAVPGKQPEVVPPRSAPTLATPTLATPAPTAAPDPGAVQDAAVTAKVTYALIAEPDLKALGMDVRTSSGVVTLSGVADSESTREKAVEVARHVEGVRAVQSAVSIEPERK